MVRLADVKDVESELITLLEGIDAVVRMRPRVVRMLRILKSMDPEMTPTRYVSPAPSKAYRTSTEEPVVRRLDSIVTGPRFGVPEAKKKDP